MEWLNYHHLLYCWTVARVGGVVRGSEELQLTQATVSAQLKALEEALGQKLFRKAGRNLALTATGKLVFRYTDEIFSLGQEMLGTLRVVLKDASRVSGWSRRCHAEAGGVSLD